MKLGGMPGYYLMNSQITDYIIFIKLRNTNIYATYTERLSLLGIEPELRLLRSESR